MTQASPELLAEDPDAVDLDAPADGLLDAPAVLFKISRLWKPGMDEDAVYDAIYGWWRMGPKREKAEYALAIAQGQVRGAFRVLGWQPRRRGDRMWEQDAPGEPRWGFEGEPAPELAHLIGRDVRHLYPRGAANPVRYLNCDGPPTARVARLATSLPVAPSSWDELQQAVRRLHANPVLHMSLHSKELFHSNVIAWLVEAHPDLGQAVLAPWLEQDPTQEVCRVRREHHSVDLVVELPGSRPLVVENKVFSLPDEAQLQKYDEVNLPAAGLAGATRVLLSLPDPGWPAWQDWTWVSYAQLADQLETVGAVLGDRDAFAGQLLERYVQMVRDLLHVVDLTRVHDDAETVALDADRIELLRTVRLHDVVQKLRARRLLRHVQDTCQQQGRVLAKAGVAMANGSVLIDAAVRLPNGDLLGWQLQAAQWRRFLMAPDLAGTGPEAKAARTAYADAHYGDWFTFGPEQTHGPFPQGPQAGYNHYDPDFVYRYVKVPGLTVLELLDMAVAVLSEASTWPSMADAAAADAVRT